MNEHAIHEHDPHTVEERPYFPAAQWDQFKNEDIAAGKGVIILISSIFTIGLILYSIVALVTGM